MKSYYSIMSFLNNSVSDEKIAFGFILLDANNRPQVKFSKDKIKLIKKLNPKTYNFFDKSIAHWQKAFDMKMNNGDTPISLESLYRNSAYEQGILHFSEPKILNGTINDNDFKFYFEKWIENKKGEIEKPKVKLISNFKLNIKHNLAPLKSKIDVDYKVKKESVPDLFFNYTLDAIGANGSLLTVKSIDFNESKPGSIETTIAKYEFFLDCIIPFSENKLKLNKGHENFLVINKPVEKSENEDLYHKLINQHNKRLAFDVLESTDISKISNIVEKNKTTKFSDLLEQVE